MKKLLTLLTLTATVALGANYDLRYLQENASGKIVERILTLTPSTFLSVSANGTLQVQSSDAFRASIAAMPLAQRSTFSNANATVPAGAVYFGQTGNMTASRVVTLPAASSVSPGYQLVIADESGTVTNANTLVITRAGSDLINGATTETIATAYAHRRLISNGANAWIFDAGVARLGAASQTFSGSQTVNGNFVAGDAAGDSHTFRGPISAPEATGASSNDLVNRTATFANFFEAASRFTPMTPQVTASTSPGTGTLVEQYGWGAEINSGIGSTGRGAVNFGNPTPGQAVSYAARTVDVIFVMTVATVDAAAPLQVQFGTSGTNLQPLAASNRGFGIRTTGNSTTSVVCMVSNGTTLTESSPINVPGGNIGLSMQYRMLSVPGGTVTFFARQRGDVSWSTLWTSTSGPTGSTSDGYNVLAAITKATGTTTASSRAWIRAVLFGLY